MYGKIKTLEKRERCFYLSISFINYYFCLNKKKESIPLKPRDDKIKTTTPVGLHAKILRFHWTSVCTFIWGYFFISVPLLMQSFFSYNCISLYNYNKEYP